MTTRLPARGEIDYAPASGAQGGHRSGRACDGPAGRRAVVRTSSAIADEGLFDCEPLVPRLACTAAPDSQLLRSRLRQLAEDPLTPETRGAADTRLTTLLNGSSA
jgi:hypothetical protein